MISMIAAMGKNRVIGKNNKMPWHLPADLQWFKKITINSPVIMGRKTYQSIGRPLPERLNIVLTRDADLELTGCQVANSVEQALEIAKAYTRKDDNPAEEIFITGGAYLYELFLPKAERLYLTLIDEDFCGDTYFPDYQAFDWKQLSRVDFEADEKNPYAYSFVMLERTL